MCDSSPILNEEIYQRNNDVGMRFCFTNGLLNTEKGLLVLFNKEDYLIKKFNFNYEHHTKCELLENFLKTIIPNQHELEYFLYILSTVFLKCRKKNYNIVWKREE